ncbi:MULTISPECIES: L-threonylcarbamoyladenylate synthase [Thiorhodovibrio]|uniref:L-threonylcarbamoyladenylate synthase n=1 Tax=Thiorhodovibrio TaxID=61593 RepID=UPI0019113A66|nr:MULTISPECIES: Sua5/YciO/YrdC/YwlC family protein [Thiorhodovibrio]MBK5969736.1 tRNA threonylcarbamoyladenosine biosynthesis protein RimN [Thiorhodovibrio winogradskyi]WPL13786.1 t(6)A37 threonylcarbamoyladenosine biosynthesis protein RimN [Thiorhodovibrio litoralis]
MNHRLRLARDVLRSGGVLAYPTEAVYGLGCDPRNERALERLLALKQRSPDKGLILIAADYADLRPFVLELAPERMAEIFASWPGPNTWLLPARGDTSQLLTGRFDTLAVRVTAHPLAAALCRAFAGALVSTSANLASRPPARRAWQIGRRLDSKPDYGLVGDCGGRGQPSRIRDGRSGQVLRA